MDMEKTSKKRKRKKNESEEIPKFIASDNRKPDDSGAASDIRGSVVNEESLRRKKKPRKTPVTKKRKDSVSKTKKVRSAVAINDLSAQKITQFFLKKESCTEKKVDMETEERSSGKEQ